MRKKNQAQINMNPWQDMMAIFCKIYKKENYH